jgi:hypothetical protein
MPNYSVPSFLGPDISLRTAHCSVLLVKSAKVTSGHKKQEYAWFPASSATQMISALVLDIMRCRFLILYRRFGATCQSHLQDPRSPRKIFFLDFLTFEDRSDGLSRNVGTELYHSTLRNIQKRANLKHEKFLICLPWNQLLQQIHLKRISNRHPYLFQYFVWFLLHQNVNWICQILHRNCLLKHVTEGKIEG